MKFTQLKEVLEKMAGYSPYVCFIREDGQDSAVVNTQKPDLESRMSTALNEMLCLDAEDRFEILNANYFSGNMAGEMNVKIIQDNEEYYEKLTVTIANVY